MVLHTKVDMTPAVDVIQVNTTSVPQFPKTRQMKQKPTPIFVWNHKWKGWRLSIEENGDKQQNEHELK